MKKSFAILLTALALAACGNGQDKESANDSPVIEQNDANSSSVREDDGEIVEMNELQQFDEYEMLAKHIDLAQFTSKLQTNNQGNRIILFINAQNEKVYKSIFIKHDQHLKIIDLNTDALLFNDVIENEQDDVVNQSADDATDDGNAATESDDTTQTTDNSGISDYAEFQTIANYIDTTSHTGNVQSDNKGNRIIIFSDLNGHKKYKSIFVKRANRLKIVHFDNDGLIFNDVIK